LGSEEEADVVQDYPRDFLPRGMVGVEFDFAVAMEAKEGFKVIGEVAERRQKFLFDDEGRGVLAKKLEQGGSAADFFGEGVELGVNHAGFGFAEGEECVVETIGVVGADG